MTPQTLLCDLKEKRLDPSTTGLLILDEAHRATGNYAYCPIVNLLDELHVGFRLVSLSATPTSQLD